MTDRDALKEVFRAEQRPSRREVRAERTRAEALSPVRILLQLLGVPIVAAAIGTSVYIRTSPYDSADALRHLIAQIGCGPADAVALAPAYEGEIGYHVRNDSDGNGVACEAWGVSGTQAAAGSQPVRRANGAKFLTPAR